jgi:hypothetical protein
MSSKVFKKKFVIFIICFIGGSFLILSSTLSGIGLAPKLWEILTSSPIPNYELFYILIVFSSIFVARGGISLIIGTFVDFFDQGKIGTILCGLGTIIGVIFILIGAWTMNLQFEPHYGEIYLLFYDDGTSLGLVGVLISIIGTVLSKSKNKD